MLGTDLHEREAKRHSQPERREQSRDPLALLRDKQVNEQQHTSPHGQQDERLDRSNGKVDLCHAGLAHRHTGEAAHELIDGRSHQIKEWLWIQTDPENQNEQRHHDGDLAPVEVA